MFCTFTVASIGIVNKLNQFPIQIIFGFRQGVMPLIGYNYAAKNSVRVKQTNRKIFEITLGALFVVVLIFSKVFGLYGLAYSACCAEILMAIIASVVLKKLMKKLA